MTNGELAANWIWTACACKHDKSIANSHSSPLADFLGKSMINTIILFQVHTATCTVYWVLFQAATHAPPTTELQITWYRLYSWRKGDIPSCRSTRSAWYKACCPLFRKSVIIKRFYCNTIMIQYHLYGILCGNTKFHATRLLITHNVCTHVHAAITARGIRPSSLDLENSIIIFIILPRYK